MDNNLVKDFKNYTYKIKEERITITKLNKFFNNPLSSFIVLSVILALVQLVYSLSTMLGFSIIGISTVRALGTTIIYAIISIGFCLLLGYGGLASLGTAGFIGIGSYIAYYFFQGISDLITESTGKPSNFHLPFILCFLATVGIAIGIGMAVGFISLRIEGIYLAIITLGLSEILRSIMVALESSIQIDLSNIKLFGIDLSNIKFEIADKVYRVPPTTFVFFLLVGMLFLFIMITVNLINSPTGRAMLAMKNSTAAAQAYGISLMKYRLLAFVLSTVYAAVAGILYMMYFRSIQTVNDPLLTISTSLNILGAVIIGGTRSIWGVTLGTFMIYGFNTLVLQNIPFFSQHPTLIALLMGIMIILVVMFYPGGLAQLGAQIKQWVRKFIKKCREAKYGKDVG